MKKHKLAVLAATGLLGISLLAGCGSQTAEASANAGGSAAGKRDSAETGDVRTIKFAFVSTSKPIGYVDEDGNATGYDIEVLRLADELLPEYEFEFIPTTQQDACAGAMEGKYHVAITNSFYTEERANNYIIPEQFLGASVGVLITRSEYADVKNFEDAVAKGLKYAPVTAGDGFSYVVKEYNEKHPDAQIELEPVDNIEVATQFQYIAEGRYDYVGAVQVVYDSLVASEDGALHDAMADKIVCNPFFAIKTYTLISPDEPEFAERLNGALKTLYENGSMSEKSLEFYGEDVFRYLDDDGGDRAGLTE